MKIIIIGAGISGLTTYLFLRKHLPNFPSHEITIYEAYDISKLYEPRPPSPSSPSSSPTLSAEAADHFLVTAIGNALGITSNGLRVLARLDPALLADVVTRGCPVYSWRMTNARGWKLADIKMPSAAAASASASPPDASVSLGEPGGKSEDANQQQQQVQSIMIARQAVWEALRSRVPAEAIMHRKVVDVVVRKAKRNEVAFADGGVEEADLVIGADGLRSIVRTAMFREEMVVGGRDYITPRYEGLSGVGGFIDGEVLTGSGCVPGTMNLVFGPNGFFGYGIVEGDKGQNGEILKGTRGAWWSTYHEPTCPDKKNIDKKAISEALDQRHKTWKNNTVKAILKHVSEDGKGLDDVYPTWTTPELPTWEKYGCVLVGDAAHALQPSSGQGTSQAFEDAEAFTLLLAHYMKKTTEVSYMAAVEKASKDYVALRRPRLHEIYVKTQQMSKMKGDQGFLMEMVVSAAIYLMTFFKDSYTEKLMNYDVPKEVEALIKPV